MLIRVYKDSNKFDEFKFQVTDIREVLSGIKMVKGQDYTNKLINENYKYILIPKDTSIDPISLNQDTVLTSFNDFDTIVILPDVSGADPVSIVAIWAAVGVTTTTTSTLVFVTQMVIMTAASMAINGIMSLLSPTTSFSSDPSQAQKQSNLFNGAPMITEQGGSVPLWYGESYAGGVLVSSGVSTTEG